MKLLSTIKPMAVAIALLTCLVGQANAASYITVKDNANDPAKQDVTYAFDEATSDDLSSFGINKTDTVATVYYSNTKKQEALMRCSIADLSRLAFHSANGTSKSVGKWWFVVGKGLQLYNKNENPNGIAILNLKAGDVVSITGIHINKSHYTFPGAASIDSFTQENPQKGGGEAEYTVTYGENGVTINVISDGYVASYVIADNYGFIKNIVITEAKKKATVADAKFATYAPEYNTVVPSDSKVKFYTAKASTNGIVLTPVADGSVLEAGTGYVIAADKGDYTFSLSSDAATTFDNNDLKVAGTKGVKADANSMYYVLTKNSKKNKVGFGKVASGVTIPAGKCYLDLANSTANVSLTADFLEMVSVLTGIDAVNAEIEPQTAAAGENVYYTLQGVKVAKPTKGGIYIVNGKKVIIK